MGDRMMRRIGIASWAFTDMTLTEKVRMFADMDYTAVSVLGGFLSEFDADDLASAERIMEKHDMIFTVHSALRAPDGVVNKQACLDQLEGILKWHRKTGRIACVSYDVAWINVAPGLQHTDPEAIPGLFEKLLEMSASSGFRMALEDYPLDNEKICLFAGWRERFPHWGILIDLGHMNIRLNWTRLDTSRSWDKSVVEFLSAIPLKIVEFHVHNNNGAKDEHLPPYMGIGDLSPVARFIDDTHFDGISTVEFGRAWCQGDLQTSITAAQESVKFWKSKMEEQIRL